jgi:hypothetical protein
VQFVKHTCQKLCINVFEKTANFVENPYIMWSVRLVYVMLIILSPYLIWSQKPDKSTQYPDSYNSDYLSLPEHRNFYDVIQLYDKYHDTDSTEGSHYKQLKKLEMLWGKKMFPSGLSNDLGAAITEYSRNFNIEKGQSCYAHAWKELGPVGKPERAGAAGGSGQIHAIRVSPEYRKDKTVYAASNWGGLWRKIGDAPWKNLNTDTQLPFTSVSDIAIDPKNTASLYITTGDAEMSIGHHAQNHDGTPSKMTPLFTAGVYRSRDGGKIWHHINGGPDQILLNDFEDGGTIRKILLHPDDSNTLIITSSEGVYICENAQSEIVSWRRIFHPINDRELKGLEFRPAHSNTIYTSGVDIYRTINGGSTWTTMTGPGTGLDLQKMPDEFKVDRINIAVTEANNQLLYAYIVGIARSQKGHNPRLYIYRYNGAIWQELLMQNDLGGSGFITPIRTPIICDPRNENNLCFGREILWGSSNIMKGALRLTGYNSGNIHADIHALEFIPGENKVFIGSDGGVHIKDLDFQNTSGGIDISEGLGVKTIYRFDDSNNSSERIIIGSQDTGTDVFQNGTWTFIDGGDGYNGKVDSRTGLAFYSMNNRLRAYDWDKRHFQEDKRPIDPASGKTAWIRGTYQMKNHPITEKMVFSMTELYQRRKHKPAEARDEVDSLWIIRSDVGKHWLIGLSGVQVAQSNSNDALLVEPRLFLSRTGGCEGLEDYHQKDCFEDITDNLIKSGAINKSYGIRDGAEKEMIPVITSVLFHPENHLIAWVTFTGYTKGVKLWATHDGGSTWFNTDPEGKLQNLPVNDIVYQKGSPNRLYIGTDAGVYYKDDKVGEWTKFCDFPNAIVTTLKINYCAGKLRASTFGRGLWEADLLSSDETLGEDYLIIRDKTIWDFSRGLDRNIKILEGAELIIVGSEKDKTRLSMPLDGEIYVEGGGKLTLNNAIVTNNCNMKWKGIFLEGKSDYIDKNIGQIEIKQSEISNVKNPIRVGNFKSDSNKIDILLVFEKILKNIR